MQWSSNSHFQTLVQRMQVVSVRLHFLVSPNIIWLPWQRPLTNRKIRYRSIIWWKDCENWSSISWYTKYASFLAVSYQTFTNELSTLDQVHEIFTQHRGIICAVNMHTEGSNIPFCLWMSERRMRGVCHSFHKIGYNGNVPWDIEVQIDHLHPKHFHSVKRLQKLVQQILR